MSRRRGSSGCGDRSRERLCRGLRPRNSVRDGGRRRVVAMGQPALLSGSPHAAGGSRCAVPPRFALPPHGNISLTPHAFTRGTTMPHDFQPLLDYAFTIGIELTGARWIKPTSIGMTRAAVYAGSGTIDGPMLRGRVIPMSGGDFPLVRADGVIDFDARYLLEAEDGTVIY